MARKSFLPRGLYGRAALILIVPVVTIQLVVSVTFIQRHFERVTEQLTGGVAVELALLLEQVERAPDAAAARVALGRLAGPLKLDTALPAASAAPVADRTEWSDLSGRVVIRTLRAALPALAPVDLVEGDGKVRLHHPTRWGALAVEVPRTRMSATNPHQLLVLMIVTSILMTVIAYLFLSNQLRPIARLADAAEAFGKGQVIPYSPRGAIEVRAAGHAFLDMRDRIERQIEQRTLMLSGVSHDLRTPLTRLRLGLSLLPEDEETEALLGDVAEMERLVDEFLAFARGDATEAVQPVDPAALARRVVENAERIGREVRFVQEGAVQSVPLRPQAVARALENLVGNALRHGTRAQVTLAYGTNWLRFTVEDDGPGIPAARRAEAMAPFGRLDSARDPNRGGGVGLGLSIAADIARSHGGELRLGKSEALGGLKAELLLAR
ncbi:HAMP domain-containing protein [Rhodobacteraceae bacterium HSP-20]|uniref:histidine kinase n=1 Tax=Paragemmobacter amnigenus TaxID=2852097 RepID=A0ABS6J7J2_9RHOB|nr:ATP-binding protein [Rhodobacter amnigenus]MBU9699520.1 HAMP domain-containing protein [Rhodobacter amnigenus]MBV4390747.1 HAMP domain-containing protein [Rhodobacter amnigenus]